MLQSGRLVNVHRLASVPGRGLIAIRPDGSIGFRCQTTEVGQVAAWLTRLGAWQPEAPAGPPAAGTTSCTEVVFYPCSGGLGQVELLGQVLTSWLPQPVPPVTG